MHETEKIYREALAPLNAREQQFVQHYLVSGNAAGASRKAGYSSSSLHTSQQIGHENMMKPDVFAAMQAGLAMITHRCEVDADHKNPPGRICHVTLGHGRKFLPCF